MAQRNTPARTSVKTLVNPGIWRQIFNEPRLLACLMEIIKNGFDWSAQTVNFITDQGRDKFAHVDDGCGMSEDNRFSFLAAGHSNAGGQQSGNFGTGAKKMIFTHASHVRVMTAPEDEPNMIYICDFTPEELADAYNNTREMSWAGKPKTHRSWPHEHAFGTEVTYTLADPSSKVVLRGDVLARRLSQRLDFNQIENAMVLVDGQRLPAKRLTGRLFSQEYPQAAFPAIGRLKFEFYRPANKSADEDLRMTGRAIGEVSFRDSLLKNLTDDLRLLVPQLFLESEVCGLITADFLNEYITERRDSYRASLADDERLVMLLRLMGSIEADVASRLGIKLRHLEDDEVEGKAQADEFIDKLRVTYDDPAVPPPGKGGQADESDPKTPRRRGGTQGPRPGADLPRLVLNQPEFEIGEEIVVRLVVPGGSTEGFYFYLGQAHAKVETTGSSESRLRAETVGRGLISASNPKTGQTAFIEYDVVEERFFHLSSQGRINLRPGSEVTISAVNPDKLTGQLIWTMVGDGEMTVAKNGLSVRYKATETGTARITATDSGDAGILDDCDILVLPQQGDREPFRIRGEFFLEEYREVNTRDFRKPATIIRGGTGDVHRLIFNTIAPGYAEARKQGQLSIVLAYATAVEFARTFCVDGDDLDPTDDMHAIIRHIQNEAAVILEEFLR